MSFFETSADIEASDSLHLGRLLVLLEAFAGKDQTGTVDGLTKLAKLDFLLRYPVNLEKALTVRGRKGSEAKVADFERNSIESRMVRYRFGPWDFRYRRFLNVLTARGLVQTSVQGRTVRIGLSSRGAELAQELIASSDFKLMSQRAHLLKSHCDLSATNLMKFIYETFPELSSMRAGQAIEQ
jgi:hypothetical protein